MQEKLAKWKEEAELARLRDPDSAVTRAAKMFENGENEFLSNTSPRGMAVNRMVKLKDTERRYEISSDLRKKRLEELSTAGSKLQDKKSETQEQFEQFAQTYDSPTDIDELEREAMDRRPTTKITSKLEVWRKAAEDARSKDVRRLLFDLLTGTFYGVAYVIGWILRKPINLSPRAGTPKVVDPGELLEMRMNMRGSADYYQTMADEESVFLQNKLKSNWGKKSQKGSSLQLKNKVIALISEDDGQALEELLRDSVDSPQDYQTMLGFSDSPSFLPLAIAIKQNRPYALEVLLKAGSNMKAVDEAGRSMLELAREVGNAEMEKLVSEYM